MCVIPLWPVKLLTAESCSDVGRGEGGGLVPPGVGWSGVSLNYKSWSSEATWEKIVHFDSPCPSSCYMPDLVKETYNGSNLRFSCLINDCTIPFRLVSNDESVTIWKVPEPLTLWQSISIFSTSYRQSKLYITQQFVVKLVKSVKSNPDLSE